MEMRSGRLLLWLCIALAAMSSCALAQELTVFVGGIFPGSATVDNAKTSLDRGPMYGLRLSAPFAVFLKLEGSLAYSNDLLFPSGNPSVTNAKGVLADANLVLGLPFGKVVPYATAGMGIIHQYGSQHLPVGTKLGVNYGGGLKMPKLFGPMGLRFDARGRSALNVFSSAVTMFEFSGGVMFSF